MPEDRLQYCHQLLDQTAVLQDFTGSTALFDESVRPVTLTWRAPARGDDEGSFLDWWQPKDLQSALQLATRTSPEASRLHGQTDIWIASQSFRHLGVAGGPGTGKTTLARHLARHWAEHFVKDQEQLFPLLLDVNGARADFAADLEMALQDVGPVLVIIDGLGRVENDWDLVRDQLGGRDSHRVRSVIFAESARATRILDTTTTWSYIQHVTGIGTEHTDAPASTDTALLVRLRHAVRDRRMLDGSDLNLIGSLLLELFAATPTDGPGQPTLSLMRAIEDGALTLELRRPEDAFWLRELVDAVTTTQDGRQLEARELQAIMPNGALGRWLMEPVPGTSRYRFTHSLIKDALVLRALARRENREIAELLGRLPSGPTRARFTSGILTYLKATGEEREQEPRWRSLALTLCQDPDVMRIGLLSAVRAGLQANLPNGAKSSLEAMGASRNELEKARARAVQGDVSRARTPRALPTGSTKRTDAQLYVERTRQALGATPDSGLSDAVERSLANGSAGPGVFDHTLVARLVRIPKLWGRIFSALEDRELFSFLERSIDTEAGVDRLLEVDIADCNLDARRQMAATFGLVLQQRTLTALETLATDDAWQVRRQVALTLGARGSNIGDLLALREDSEPNVRLAVLTAALLTSEPWGAEIVNQVLESGNSSERAVACYALKSPTPSNLDTIREFSEAEDVELRIAAAVALGDSGRALKMIAARPAGQSPALMGPGFHMSYGQVLTETPGGDLSSTVSWHAMSQMGRLLDTPSPDSMYLEKVRAVGDNILQLLLSSPPEFARDSVEVRAFAHTLERVLDIHPDPESFSSQVLGALATLDTSSFAALSDAWSASLRRVSSREITDLLNARPPTHHPHIVAAVLLGRFGDRNTFSNVLRRHEYAVLRHVGAVAAVDGILLAVNSGRLTMGHLTQSAELLTDVLSRFDLPLSEGTLRNATQLMDFVRSPKAMDVRDLNDPQQNPFALAWGLLEAGRLLGTALVDEAGSLLEAVPDLLRGDSWLALRERCWFSQGCFEDVLRAHESRRNGIHWAVSLIDTSLLAARAANIERRGSVATKFLGVGAGRAHDVVKAQRLIIDGRQSEALALCQRWSEGDLYASCLEHLASGSSTASIAAKLNEGRWRIEELAQLHAEFSHAVYESVDASHGLVDLLRNELTRRSDSSLDPKLGS